MTRRIHNPILSPPAHSHPAAAGFTLVEMLIAMAITLVMIGAVVTLFANISNSVRNRRAVIEMSGQLRHARNMLQQDLQGATCNGLVWQRPDENQGYIEIIEGPQREGQASILVDGTDNVAAPVFNPELDHRTSIIPSSNVPFADSTWLTDGGSLGDGDDTLMLTVRNEHEPFVGRVPVTDASSSGAVRPNDTDANSIVEWESTTLESPLAEVIWYSIENPEEASDANGFFGEPGMRTIYRRTLLIAPWFNPYHYVNPNTGAIDDTFRIPRDNATFTAQPGLVRILPDDIDRDAVAQAIACLIAFQERYDLSVRLEFDPLLGSSPGRWKIVANTLGDLTKRENRYEHIGYGYDNYASPAQFSRIYPYPIVSLGADQTDANVAIANDPELVAPAPAATVRANLSNDDNVVSYQITDGSTGYQAPPFLYFTEDVRYQATARAMLNDEGEIVRVIHGPVPLSGERRGEDVMLSDALGFDLRVYDPGAPLFAHRDTETVLEPTDPAWTAAYMSSDNLNTNGTSSIGRNNAGNPQFPFVGQGAYVDLGYGFDARRQALIPPLQAQLPVPQFASAFSSATVPWFFAARALSDVYGNQLAPGYAVFDTWSFHYENNGLNEDHDVDASGNAMIDEGTNGLDDRDPRIAGSDVDKVDHVNDIATLGPDDVGERETAPPYDKPLRGVQVLLRLYERDSRQVRQVSVNQSFVPE
jgi:prepilin-type N-terminal cleavage/methylation domain-containing protein